MMHANSSSIKINPLHFGVTFARNVKAIEQIKNDSFLEASTA